MQKVLIKNADWIITMDAEKSRLRNSDILIDGKKIEALGKDLIHETEADIVIDASRKLIIPGMVNIHHHCFQSLIRNIHAASGLKLEPWLKIIIGSAVNLTEDVLVAGALVGLGDLLKTGCTTSNNHHLPHPNKKKGLIDMEIETACNLGIRYHALRGSYTRGYSDGSEFISDALVETPKEICDEGERLIKKYHDAKPYAMCRVGMSTVMPTEDTDEGMLAIADLVQHYDVHCHTHSSETAFEIFFCQEKWGCTPTERLAKLNWLGDNFYFAHCVHLTDNDIDLMTKSGTGVAHCPSSNMILNSGVCRLPDLISKGAKVGIGVDGAASNNSSNMMHEIRTAYLLNRLAWGDRSLSPEQILEMATIGGASVLGRDDIGYLAPEMAADLVILDWDQLQYAGGKNDPVSSIVMSGDARMVDMVMVNGQIVVKQGKLLTVDEEATANFVNRIGKKYLRDNCERFPVLQKDIT